MQTETPDRSSLPGVGYQIMRRMLYFMGRSPGVVTFCGERRVMALCRPCTLHKQKPGTEAGLFYVVRCTPRGG